MTDIHSPIRAGIGPGFFHRIFGGKSAIHCLMELIKNTRDWGASQVWIQTEDPARLVVRDDGNGMNARNRDAFASVNMTTAGVGMSGQFCTGTKQALYSLATMVEVITAPTDDPEHVYSFSFTTGGYEDLALKGGTLKPKRVKKTGKNWPFNHSFGTQLTYLLLDTRSKRILRGTRLAEELASRLPLKFKDVLFVDGARLPGKEIVGRVYFFEESHPQLGAISMEIYRPARRRTEEALRLTSVEIGEASVSNLFRVLGDYRDQFPEVLLLPQVCGTLSVPFLGEYAMEDRITIRAELIDDPRLVALLEVLNRTAPEIQDPLEIRMRGAEGDDVKQEIESIRTICNRRYLDKGVRPLGGSGDDDDDNSSGGAGGNKSQPPITLSCRSEFELGELIEVGVRLRKNLGHTVEALRWYHSNARATNFTVTPKGATMVASEVGTGTIRVDLPGTLHSVVRAFQIVAERVFRLSVAHATVPVAGSVTVHAVNADKLKGDLEWSLSGNGEIQKNGNAVTYIAPRYPSRATLVGYDRANMNVRATCELTVVGQLDTLCIRGTHFMVTTYDAPGDDARLVSMAVGGDPHQVIFNTGAPGFKASLKAGTQRDLLLLALAQEFPAFQAFELEGTNLADLDPRDVPQLLRDLTREGFVIYQELIEGV